VRTFKKIAQVLAGSYELGNEHSGPIKSESLFIN
jgi:hypothetical protein